ncbi:hypothetical protein BSPWISOXPB_7545 [uncultured Gammaproteobacteria bacterium]|nr:hypothetical protein BSPWISOXPB_7545 [uncultured Gammaproteobacteria bacterium]
MGQQPFPWFGCILLLLKRKKIKHTEKTRSEALKEYARSA